MGLLERVNSALPGRQRSDSPLDLDTWANYFGFGGLDYPVVQTTMSSINEERVGLTTSAAIKMN
ncbi:hypothetical protein ABZ608_41425, partial [Streptomyces sp. NPDC013172]